MSELEQLRERNEWLLTLLATAKGWLEGPSFNPPESCGRCGGPDSNCDGNCMAAAYWSQDYSAIKAALAASKGQEAVQRGLRQARARQFVPGPDLDADAAIYAENTKSKK